MIASFPQARATVYGVLLNDRATLQRLTPKFDSAPYQADPALRCSISSHAIPLQATTLPWPFLPILAKCASMPRSAW